MDVQQLKMAITELSAQSFSSYPTAYENGYKKACEDILAKISKVHKGDK